MTGESTAKTTVVVPVWDAYAGERLSEALQSVSSQERPPRIVVVDNASTVELSCVEGATIVSCPRRYSLGAARNVGLATVETPYVVFWDADDLMLPGTIAYLEDRLDRDPGLVAFGMAIIEESSGLRHRWPREWLGTLTGAPRLLALLDALWSVFPTTGATTMRTAVVRDAGGYADTDSGEDWCLGVSLLFRGRVGWSERPGRVYAQSPGSVWASHSDVRHQLAHAAVVRRRLATDVAVPPWLRTLLPVLGAVQAAAVVAHLALARVRRFSKSP